MDQQIQQQLQDHKELLQNIFRSTEKTRKYFLWTLIVSLVVFVLPLLGLLFILPSALSGLSGGLPINLF